jgi:hypothetical protein
MSTTNSHSRRTRPRVLLVLLFIVALCAWGGLLLFTYYIQPKGAPAVIGAFLLLSPALFCTCTLLTYLISRVVLARRGRRPNVSLAVRQGGLISAWLIFNLLLRSLHSWSVFIAVVSFGIIVVIELLVIGRA